jgi:phosphoenolpyruvate carboxylase
MAAMQALWGQCLQQLLDRHVDPDQIGASLPQMHLELVLTAHPTEAKRTIVLDHHRSLYLLLVKRENQMWTPYEQRAIREEIKTVLSLLWRRARSWSKNRCGRERATSCTTCMIFPEVLPAWIDGCQTWAYWVGRGSGPPQSLPRFSEHGWEAATATLRDGRSRVGLEDLRLHGLF